MAPFTWLERGSCRWLVCCTCSLLPGCVELGPRLTRSNPECVILQASWVCRSQGGEHLHNTAAAGRASCCGGPDRGCSLRPTTSSSTQYDSTVSNAATAPTLRASLTVSVMLLCRLWPIDGHLALPSSPPPALRSCFRRRAARAPAPPRRPRRRRTATRAALLRRPCPSRAAGLGACAQCG